MIKHLINRVKHAVRDHITGGKRSSKWGEVKKQHLKEYPTCASCGTSNKLEVHHIKPFHLHPDLELEQSNLITLCMESDCHLLVGHGDNFKAYNPNVVDNANIVLQSSTKASTLQQIAAQAKQNRLFE